jgi:prolyl 4-hydroxylase
MVKVLLNLQKQILKLFNMKRIDIIKKKKFEFIKIAQPPHFIGSWNIENNELCKEIVNYFEENKSLQKAGVTQNGKNPTVKKTTDIHVTPNDLKNIELKCLNNYINELYKCFIDYQNQWPFLKQTINEVDIGAFNIQKYSKGDHFAKVHSERCDVKASRRIFAWMTYLNDVDDGGRTYFDHYKIKIKPEIGKTLIWPAEWTHAHSGEILNSGVKHIVTGWMNLPYS